MELVEEETSRVRVQFTTKHDDLRVTDTSIAVPSTLGRRGLSEIVNHLLELPGGHVPLDFIHVDTNKSLRAPLDRFLQAEGISNETVVVLEYLPALQEPEVACEQKEPDWIASIDLRGMGGTKDSAVGIVGSFDGAIEVIELAKGKIVTLARVERAHAGAVKGVASCVVPGNSAPTELFASASKDGSLRVWRLEREGESASLSNVGTCNGHSNSVEAVAATSQASGGFLLASGGWDKTVTLWELNNSDGNPASDGSRANKKTKGNGGDVVDGVTEHHPLGVFQGHTDNVSCVSWDHSNKVLFSGGWDHTVRAWDVEQQVSTATWTCNKVVTSLCNQPGGQMMATGHPDNCVRLWDARAGGDSSVQAKLDGHSGWVTDVAWCPTRDELLLSASVDKTVNVWDIRSKVPLYTMSGHNGKVLTVDWATLGDEFVSGGDDCKLVQYTVPKISL